MLLTKTVMMKWIPKTKKYYEEKGYIFKKMYDEFEVKVEDLTDGSNVLVEVKCDCEDCKAPYLKPMTWQKYLRYIKEDNKYYCNKCALKLYGFENIRKSKLAKGKSFEQWCLNNNRKDILDRFDYKLNNKRPSQILFGSNKKYWFKCPRGLHKSELKNINSFTQGNEGSMYCRYCSSFAQWGVDKYGKDFLREYLDYERNEELGINPWEISYGSNNKKVWIKCQNRDKLYHESYEITCNEYLGGNRCPYCNSNSGKVHPLDSLGQYIIDNYGEEFLKSVWSDKNKKSAFEYTVQSHQEVYWKCIDYRHEDYLRMIQSSNDYEFRCPECVQELDTSIIQTKTNSYLEKLNYKILHEDKCTIKPKNIIEPPKGENVKRGSGVLRYDNEIIVKNNMHLIIEVMGQQHEKVNIWHIKLANKYDTAPQQELDYQIAKDKFKKEYAESKGYEYLAVWYYDFDKEDTYKKLINNKIKEIKTI